MKRRYSVFLGNVGSCSDRYCAAYAPPFHLEALFARVASIPLVTAVDLVATPDLLAKTDLVRRLIRQTGLRVISVAADTFTEARWRHGSFSARDAATRRAAVEHAKEVMAFAESLGSDLLTIWPGQDGYDYHFQTDYTAARQHFAEGLAELCRYKPAMRVGVEYKLKEPRTFCHASTVGTTLLLAQATGCANCQVILDYGHAVLGQENPAESVALLAQHGNRLAHIHINDNYGHWDDDLIVGSVHAAAYLEFLHWLRRTGYAGWMTIDQFPYREDGRDAVAESAAWLDYLEGLLDRADPAAIDAVLAQGDGVAASRLMRGLLSGTIASAEAVR
jgi:xylose isomerase